MTDTDKTNDETVTDKTTVDNNGAATTETSLETPVSNKGKSRGLILVLVFLIILVLALGGALFYQQQQYQNMKQDLQNLSDSNVSLVQKAQDNAAAALKTVRDQANKISSLSQALDATNNQLQEIDRALQLVTDSGSDLLLLNDIDHLVTVAEQQLLLGGNVANAIISLEAAQAQLARANRAAFVSLQQAINGDIDKLRAVSTVNLSALSNKVDDLVNLIGSAPLLIPDAYNHASSLPDENNTAANDEKTGFNAPDESYTDIEYWNNLSKQLWQQSKEFGQALSGDLKQLFDIRKIDDEAALLMSPEQAQRFRETLSQRAITAQLALLMQQTKIWHDELSKIADAIDKRYDMASQEARNALKLARELYDTSIEAKLPKLKNSLAAIAAVRDDISAKESAAEASEQSAESN